jgi:hypothetical protein
VLRHEKTYHCAGALAAVEQPPGVFVVEEVGDDGSLGRLLSLAVMPSFYAATRTVKNFLLGGAHSVHSSSTKIFVWFSSSKNLIFGCSEIYQHVED